MMTVKIWGCRGSIPSPGANKDIYGGNTSCVQIMDENTCIILDGGSGIQNLGENLKGKYSEIHLLLTHLHLDHILGLGFFKPFYDPKRTIHIWGPSATKETLQQRLRRYFSPPMFPVQLSGLPSKLIFHEVNFSEFEIGNFKIRSDYVCHPGPTVGYRIMHDHTVFTYMPDHEPVLGSSDYPNNPEWTSGYSLARNADLLMHDGQYQTNEYDERVGWGHCSVSDALKFGKLTGVKKMLLFHHDPMHTDKQLKSLFDDNMKSQSQSYEVELAKEGETYYLL